MLFPVLVALSFKSINARFTNSPSFNDKDLLSWSFAFLPLPTILKGEGKPDSSKNLFITFLEFLLAFARDRTASSISLNVCPAAPSKILLYAALSDAFNLSELFAKVAKILSASVLGARSFCKDL